jgi:hypothetical protein
MAQLHLNTVLHLKLAPSPVQANENMGAPQNLSLALHFHMALLFALVAFIITSQMDIGTKEV